MPAFLIAMLTGPVSRYFVLGGLLLALIAGVGLKVISDARQAERARIERQERKNAEAAKRELDRLGGGDDSRVRGFDRD